MHILLAKFNLFEQNLCVKYLALQLTSNPGCPNEEGCLAGLNEGLNGFCFGGGCGGCGALGLFLFFLFVCLLFKKPPKLNPNVGLLFPPLFDDDDLNGCFFDEPKLH